MSYLSVFSKLKLGLTKMSVDELLKKLFYKETRDINLIPQRETTKLKSGSVFLSLVILAITALLFTGAFTLHTLREKELENLNSKIGQLETGEWAKVKTTANLLSSAKIKISNYKKFSAQFPPIDQKLNILNETIPQTIKLQSLSIQSPSSITASAKAEKPEDISMWISKMKSNKLFQNIKVSSIQKGANVYMFSISLDLI